MKAAHTLMWLYDKGKCDKEYPVCKYFDSLYKPNVPVPPAHPRMDIIPLTLIIWYLGTGAVAQEEDDLYE